MQVFQADRRNEQHLLHIALNFYIVRIGSSKLLFSFADSASRFRRCSAPGARRLCGALRRLRFASSHLVERAS